MAATSPLRAGAANYDGVDPYEEYGKRINAAQQVSPVTDSVFGDHVSLYDGATTFRVTDVAIPGNNALPVGIGRELVIQDQRMVPVGGGGLRGFGDWDLDVPYVWGTFTQTNGWTLGNTGETDRCSNNTAVPDSFLPIPGMQGPPQYAPVKQIWNGDELHIPGQGNQVLLANTESKSPAYAGAGTWKWVTKANWKLSCVSSVTGMAGEGFVAVSPAGVSYTFNYAVTVPTSPFEWAEPSGVGNQTTKPIKTPRVNVYLLATRVEDRFGNWVTYSYSNGRLTGVSSSDGRSITLTWSGDDISTVTSALGTWRYSYATSSFTDEDGMHFTTPYLSAVTRPDGSQWTYAIDSGSLITTKEDWAIDDGTTPPNHCQIEYMGNDGALQYTVGAPSGASATYWFGMTRHYRSYVPKGCLLNPDPNLRYPLDTTTYFDTFALHQKQVSGPGLPIETWTYDYGSVPRSQYFRPDIPASDPSNSQQPYEPPGTCSACAVSKLVTVTGPTNVTQYTYGVEFARNEGQLLAKQVADLSGHVLRSTTYTYVTDAQAPNEPFADIAGWDQRGGPIDAMGNRNRPVTQTVITQDGATFTTAVNGFDDLARATSETGTGVLGNQTYSKTNTTIFADDTNRWVLGMVTQSATNGIVASQTNYDSLDRPTSQYAFGKLTSTKAWNADGTLASVTDGNGHATAFANWYRGLPQTVSFADGTGEYATVNAAGWITSVTDQSGITTNYAYDPMGRLAGITYPAGDDVAWAPTLLSFTQVNGSEYGIPAGHWKQTVHTGNGYAVTYFDAFWRPLVSERYDAGNTSGTMSQVVDRYDAGGRKVFASYPTNSASSYTQSLPGIHTAYDALGRVTEVDQDSELGTLKTTTAYLSGFQTQTTDPRGNSTLTSYQAYGQPTTKYPDSVTAPNGELTVILRDAFGKPLSITRTGTAEGSLQLTRDYVYDGHQQLCKRVDPESGATAFGYDAAGNLAWSAAGLTLIGTTSCDASAALASGRVVNRSYDALNRVTSLTFPDGNGNQAWTYTPTGQPSSMSRQNNNGASVAVTNTYFYDQRGLLISEGLTQGGATWSIAYGHDANGHLASETYPNGATATFAPNALGQPTAVDAYASGVSYYPDGKVHQFTYGNGIVHTSTENARGLVAGMTDSGAGATPLQLAYTYDADGNPTSITDAADAAQNRSLTYDALDRLAMATVGYTGATPTTFSYDVLDNLTAISQGTHLKTLTYSPTTDQLTALIDSATGTTAFTYDAQGNLATKGGQAYAFDYGNRLRWASGREQYAYDGMGRRVLATALAEGSQSILSLYSHGGQLLFQQDNRNQVSHAYLYLGSRLVATVDYPFSGGSVVRYAHSDAQGSVLVETDTTRAIAKVSVYDSWGALLNHANDDAPGYTGHLQDSQTGLTYMQQRYYDPSVGRFLSMDPVGVNTTGGGNFNRYWYANDNPYRYTDPDGRESGNLSLRSAEYMQGNLQAFDSMESGFTPGSAKAFAAVGAAIVGVGGADEAVGLVGAIRAAVRYVGAKIAGAATRRAVDGAESAAKGGRAANKLRPHSDATGAHTTFKQSADGKVSNYATYSENPQNPSGFQVTKRVDVTGKAHTNPDGKVVSTPHVKEGSSRYVRPARKDEIPGG